MEPDSFEDYVLRFDALVRSAKEHGIDAMVVLYGDDPISRSITIRRIASTDPVTQLGMTEFARLDLGTMLRPPV